MSVGRLRYRAGSSQICDRCAGVDDLHVLIGLCTRSFAIKEDAGYFDFGYNRNGEDGWSRFCDRRGHCRRSWQQRDSGGCSGGLGIVEGGFGVTVGDGAMVGV